MSVFWLASKRRKPRTERRVDSAVKIITAQSFCLKMTARPITIYRLSFNEKFLCVGGKRWQRGAITSHKRCNAGPWVHIHHPCSKNPPIWRAFFFIIGKALVMIEINIYLFKSTIFSLFFKSGHKHLFLAWEIDSPWLAFKIGREKKIRQFISTPRSIKLI